MDTVGGQMESCKIVASNPTVIAEMSFLEKSGAEKVIDTFNGKKVCMIRVSRLVEGVLIYIRLTGASSTSTGSLAAVV